MGSWSVRTSRVTSMTHGSAFDLESDAPASPPHVHDLASAADDSRTFSYLELGALPTAVPCARLHVRQVLWEWGLPELSHPTELLVSELMTNAVRASNGLTGSRFAGRWAPGVPPVRLWLPGGGCNRVDHDVGGRNRRPDLD